MIRATLRLRPASSLTERDTIRHPFVSIRLGGINNGVRYSADVVGVEN